MKDKIQIGGRGSERVTAFAAYVEDLFKTNNTITLASTKRRVDELKKRLSFEVSVSQMSATLFKLSKVELDKERTG